MSLLDVCQTVTFGVIAYNEHRFLPDLLSDLLHQSYPKKKIEVILVDGESSDETWSIMKDFEEKYQKEYSSIKTFCNHKRIQPAGWNIVIQNSNSDVILRIDAHARLPKDFIHWNMERLNKGESVCGGPRENIIDETTPYKEILLSAEKSMFGSGFAIYRKNTHTIQYVDSVFHGAYRKDVFEHVGMFCEQLERTEDNELHYRIRKAGYKICYDPKIKSFYQTRNSLRGMLRQKYLNGMWIGITLFFCPGCISLFHFVPFVFLLAIVLSSILSLVGFEVPAIILWCAYASVNLFMTFLAAKDIKDRSGWLVLLPLLFLLLHLSYGIGTFIGLFNKKKRNIRK